MLGWHVNVYRQLDGSSPATQSSPEGSHIAAWDTGISGLSWLDDLVAAGHAVLYSSQGYPERYTVQAKHVGERATVEACGPEEWLVIEAWDQS